MNVSDYLLANGRADDVVVTEVAGSATYADLRRAAGRLAAELRTLDLAPGSRVGLVGANSLFWVAAYLAIMKLGHVAVPFATVQTPESAARNADWVDLAAVFMDRGLTRRYPDILGPGGAVITEDTLNDEVPSYWPDLPAPDPDTDAVWLLTSGTTSMPKVVRLTHANIAANTDSILSYLQLRDDDRMLTVLPFFYCYGASLLHTHLRAGARVVLCNTFTFPESAVELIVDQQCTGLAGVPSTYQLLLRASTFATRKLPSLRHLQQAGGKLPPALVDELVAAQPSARVFVMYGQTEATARLSYLPPELIGDRRGSIGRGIPGVQLRVVTEAGTDVQPGEVGEIYARGANIAKGYWRDPEGTAAKFGEGELRTGDLATVDADGYLYVVDRLEDFIKSWGYRVSSQEVEAAALRMPELVAAAAIGVPDDAAGESIVLFCTVRDGVDVTPAEVVAHCRPHLSKHMVPAEVRIIPALPLNAHGKVAKNRLREIATPPTLALSR